MRSVTGGDLSDGTVSLREITASDAELLYLWRMDSRHRNMFRKTEIVPFEFHRHMIERHLSSESRDCWFIIEAAGYLLGTISLYNFGDEGRFCEFGRFTIAPESQNLGYGRRALNILMEHAHRIGVNRLSCIVLATNSGALHLYRDLGFVQIAENDEQGRSFLTLAVDLPARGMIEPIQLFFPKFRTEETLAEIRDCLDRGWTGSGYKTLEFEAAWRRYSGFAYAHFVNSGTAALHLAFMLLKEDGGWSDGDEVITTPLTFVATNHMILQARLKPVFADIDEYLCLDPASVESRITERTRAVCFVGIGGNIGRYREVRDLCRKRGLSLILDGAHMVGTWIGSEHAGLDADACALSFDPVKNLPTGDAGMVCFARKELDQEVRKWSWLGIDKDAYTRAREMSAYPWRYEVEHVGFKYQGNSVMAAIALVGLRHLDENNQRRREIANWYNEELRTLPGVCQIPQPEGFRSSRHLYQVLVDRRDEVMLGLNRHGVFPGLHYADNSSYPMYCYAQGTCPKAHSASERIISLPMHLGLTRSHICRIGKALRQVTSAP